MDRYIALLRGINVGGKNKVPMAELKKGLEKAGFVDVKTYINSGNIIFSSGQEDIYELKKLCERVISETFRLDIAVLIISASDYREAMKHMPDWWGTEAETKHNAIFIIPPANAESVIGQVGAVKPEYENIAYHGQVIFWSAALKTYSRTRWSKIAGTPVYHQVTIRNANTARKLLQLVQI